jgi:hypothetical protein
MLFRYAVIAITLLSLTACTTMQTIEDFTPAKVHQYVDQGDEVHIVMANGAVYDLVVTKVEADSLVGKADSGKHWRIKYAAIRHIEVEEHDALKSTVAGVGGGLVVLYSLAILAFVSAMDNLDACP